MPSTFAGATGLGRAAQLLLPWAMGAVVALAVVGVTAWRHRHRLASALAGVSRSGSTRDGGATLALLVGVQLLTAFAAAAVVGELGAPLMLPLGTVTLLAAWVIAAIVILVVSYRIAARPLTAWATSTLLAVALLAGAGALSARFMDFSWDGNSYHQQAVTQLAEGWNPVYQPGAGENIWVRSYPKASWTVAAEIARASGALELSKLGGLALIVAAFLVWLAFLLAETGLATLAAVAFAILVAANPVALMEAFTFMVDGELASLFSLFLAGAAMYLARREWRVPGLVLVVCAGAMLPLIKFTGVVYAGFLFLALMVAAAVNARSIRPAGPLLGAAMVAAALVVTCGWNPYVTNLITHGSPVYPLAGHEPVDVISEVTPGDFVGLPSVVQLARSVFAEASNAAGPGTETHLKLPFAISRSELTLYGWSDQKVAGLGPLFGGAVLLALLSVAIAITRRPTRSTPGFRSALILALVVLATVLVNPEAWYARFAPQLWLVPVFVALAVWVSTPRRGMRRIVAALAAVVLVVNIALVGAVNFTSQVLATTRIESTIEDASRSGEPVLLAQHGFTTFHVKLEERSIPYSLSVTAPAGPSEAVPYGPVTLEGPSNR